MPVYMPVYMTVTMYFNHISDLVIIELSNVSHHRNTTMNNILRTYQNSRKMLMVVYIPCYRLHVTGYMLHVTGYRLHVTCYRVHVTGYRLQYANI